MDPQTAAALVAAVALAVVHLLADRLHTVGPIPRSWWLSAAGGVSVSYVFVHLLPELAAAQREFAAAGAPVLGFAERHVYVVALAGLAVFYGLESAALASRRRREEAGAESTGAGVFRLHLASFALYNLLIGYLLMNREETSTRSLALYSVAMAMHFLVNDLGLRFHHGDRYAHTGRWVLAGAVLTGAGVGAATSVEERAVAVLLAFLAGGVVLNVLKEELPEERRSRFSAFALGAGGYALLLVALG